MWRKSLLTAYPFGFFQPVNLYTTSIFVEDRWVILWKSMCSICGISVKQCDATLKCHISYITIKQKLKFYASYMVLLVLWYLKNNLWNVRFLLFGDHVRKSQNFLTVTKGLFTIIIIPMDLSNGFLFVKHWHGQTLFNEIWIIYWLS
jgi:hypothetical protein